MNDEIKVLPFDITDLDFFEPREYERNTITPERMASIINNCQLWTMHYGNHIIGIVGCFEVYRGTIEAFVIPSVHTGYIPHRYVRAVKRAMNKTIQDIGNVHRVQTFSVANSQTDKWMRVLGFTWEGTLRHYMGKDVHYNCWARIL